MKGKQLQFFKVISTKGTQEADILLYGYIGQDFWWDPELKEQSITDVEFAKLLRELEKDYSKINIRINSHGGSMLHGNAIINFIRTSTAEIHTYNDGIAASMAADIWFASPNRHMANNALLMVHPASTFTYGNAKEMRAAADLLDKYTATAVAIMAQALGQTEEEIDKAYYQDYQDQWFTAKEALEAGFIEKVENYEVEIPVSEPQKMTHEQLTKAFRQLHEKPKPGMLSKMRKAFGFGDNLMIQKAIPMNKAELEKSLQDGEITIQEIAEIVGNSNDFNVEKVKPAEEPPADLSQQILNAVQAAIKPMQQKMEAMDDQIKKFGDLPGDLPAAIPKGEDAGTETDAQKAISKADAFFENAAQSGSNPFWNVD